jgi:fermentation-respiration switch protein FrsA (DUF1100 family)
MRQDITFTSKGLRCSGWLYVPDDLPAGQKMPAIVMAHGFSAVKEMHLSNFAERFVIAGFITLVFDYRYFGTSEGEPRGQFFPHEQIEDYRNAITWISDHPQVDPERIGVWGTSKSGGHVLYLAAYDKRIKAVVAQVPSVISPEARRRRDPEKYDKLGAFLIQDRITRYKTGLINYFKVVAPEGDPCVLGTTEAYEWFMQATRIAPNWRNQVTVESLEKEREFDPLGPIQLIAPTPLLMINAEYDTLALPDLVASAYERALEPKSMLLLACRHFDVYNMEPWLSKAAGAAVEWFTNYLREPHAPGRQSAV